MNVWVAMVVMLISGACNTLLMKYQVTQVVPEGPGEAATVFDHPYVQTLLMMIGEVGCLLVFLLFISNRAMLKVGMEGAPYFVIPVMCDLTATTLVNYAFLMIPASVVQMTRGAIVVFTCLFSVVFLKRRQETFHIVGVTLVAGGITMVSLSAIFFPRISPAGEAVTIIGTPLLGIGLCLLAQVFQASMLVTEEKFISTMRMDPLFCVGVEGVFGCVILAMVIPVACASGNENVAGAIYQMQHSMPLLIAVVLSIFSIAFFNWSGITVTKEASAVARSTLDCSRTILVWTVELALLWNTFHWLQFFGFITLAIGTMLYNELIPAPEFLRDQLDDEHCLLVSKTGKKGLAV